MVSALARSPRSTVRHEEHREVHDGVHRPGSRPVDRHEREQDHHRDRLHAHDQTVPRPPDCRQSSERPPQCVQNEWAGHTAWAQSLQCWYVSRSSASAAQ